MSDYCMLFSQKFYGLLFSYLTIADVTSYVDHTVHLTKSLLQTVLQMLTKNNSCMLCVPMFQQSSMICIGRHGGQNYFFAFILCSDVL